MINYNRGNDAKGVFIREILEREEIMFWFQHHCEV
jgi:hypothetical protein